MALQAEPPGLSTTYFDGRRACGHAVTVQIIADGGQRQLQIQGEALALLVPVKQVRWAERQRHGTRLTELPDGGVLSHADGPAWDAWARASGLSQPRVVGWMQSWPATLAAAAACLALLASTWAWGVPVATELVVAVLPAGLSRDLGERALAQIEAQGLAPSRLPPARQTQIQRDFAATVARAWPGASPTWRLAFHDGSALRLGPNAFALPGGQIVVTDELVNLLSDQPDAILGVLGHELGHVQHQHGLRLVVQAGLLGLLSAAVVGDASGLLSAGAVLLGQQAYSRSFEHEADLAALHLLQANRIDPGVMALAFERLTQAHEHQGTRLPIALASHPATAERIALFRQAARSGAAGNP